MKDYYKSSSSQYLWNLAGLMLSWAAVQFFLFNYSDGVKVVTDSHRYLSAANSFIEDGFGAFNSSYSFQYISYIWFLAVVLKTGGGLGLVVALQLSFSLLALLALYHSTYIISRSHSSSFLASLIFVLWVKLQAWNFYILTESLFISFCIFSFYCMLTLRKNKLFWIIFLPLLVFTAFIRPHGIVFLLAMTAYFIAVLVKSQYYKINKKAILGVSMVLGTVLLVLVGFALQDFNFMSIEIYLTGDVVYLASHYVPQFSSLSVNSGALVLPDPSLPTIFQLVQFIFQNPVYFGQLAFTKLFFFFAHFKPYYSLTHNFLIGITLYPLYLFFISGLTIIKDTSVKTFAVAFIGFQALSVMLMVEDWDGRFLMPVLPFIMVFSAIGLTTFLHHIKNRFL